MTNPLAGKDILTSDQFDLETLESVLRWTEMMRIIEQTGRPCDLLNGNILTALFYQPSSRTFGSFLSAMQRLGGGIIPIQNVDYSSVIKGEDLPDTIATFASYSDVIALRHPDNGSSLIATDATEKPIINAGSGTSEHPTQTLLDIATIENYVRRNGRSRKELVLAMIGDLKNGRTVHSFLGLWPTYTMNSSTVYCVSPESLRMPIDLLRNARNAGLEVEETTDLNEVVGLADVLYMTRVQKEWFKDAEEYKEVKGEYVITPETMERAKPEGEMILLHPFPRVDEISRDVDSDPRAQYMKIQIPYGLYTRMAILAAVLGVEEEQISGYIED